MAEDDVDAAVSSMEASETNRRRKRQRPSDVFRVDDFLVSAPWLGWLFIYTFAIFYFSASRCVALKALVTKYSSAADYTSSVKAAVMSLGFLEDFVCTTYFASALWLFDVLKQAAMDHHKLGVFARVCGGVVTFAVSWLLFLAMMGPFIADLLLVVHRDMRFSSGLRPR